MYACSPSSVELLQTATPGAVLSQSQVSRGQEEGLPDGLHSLGTAPQNCSQVSSLNVPHNA